jgi:hypothetical protein
MTNCDFSDELYLSRVGHRPSFILNRVAPVDETITLSTPKLPRNPHSSLGALDRLPLELLQDIFDLLDLQSLSRVSRVSFRGKAVVEARTAYKDLISTAGHVFQALTRTRTIGMHSAAILHAALRSDRCVSCGQYGAFLFLLTAERCCLACMWSNSCFWTIDRSKVERTCGFNDAQQKCLAWINIYTINRSGLIPARCARPTTVHAVWALGSRIRSEEGEMLRKVDLRYQKTKRMSENPRDFGNIFSSREDRLELDHWFPRFGAIPFPSLVEGRVERGLWCLGCAVRCRRQISLPAHVQIGVSTNMAYWIDMREIEERAGSEAEFLEHFKQCEWALELMAVPGMGTDQI